MSFFLRYKKIIPLITKFNKFDLAITRSGASAISELSYFNIPFVAIPFPAAKDDHQYYNAKYYENKNCCWILRQNEIDISKFSIFIENILDEKNDYFEKKENLNKISYQNTWNNINQRLINLINENAPVKIISENRNETDIIIMFNEIISEINKIDLRTKIESLENKISANLDEKLYSELLSLRNQLKSV